LSLFVFFLPSYYPFLHFLPLFRILIPSSSFPSFYFLFCWRFLNWVSYIVLNAKWKDTYEWKIEKDVEGNDRGLYQNRFLALAYRDWRKLRNISFQTAGLEAWTS
jgi:hypothetical protein